MYKFAGLLWYDADPKKDWQQKVREAAQRFQEKKWLKANMCHINPETVALDKINLNGASFVGVVDGVEVYATMNTLKDHFFVYHVSRAADTPEPQNAPAPEQLTLLR